MYDSKLGRGRSKLVRMGRFQVTAEPRETIPITLVGYRLERVVVEGAATLALILKPDNLTRRK